MAISPKSLFLSLLILTTQTPLSLSRNETIYDLLPIYGFPIGIIPNAVKSYSLSSNGDFSIELDRQCYVHFDNLVFYDKTINGKLKYGEISDVSGIQAKKLFIWVSVTGIEIESGFLEFQVGFLSEKLPVEQFQTIPVCKSNGVELEHEFSPISECLEFDLVFIDRGD
ncbi:hypothetical protein GIB67_016912 [Kingdonia uniflora]|uniref:DUF538 family protein n=1 Tax=Kingdonia uniflora TaxID=39325 RepID=A0A7J7M3K7_9MAGN|nr:hypothetical protein GIB67_016912 [Kingdonia uniflora]